MDKAKISYANAYLHEELGKVRLDAFGIVCSLMDTIMLFHGRYFKRSTKRMLEELLALPIEEVFVDNLKSIASSKDVLELRALSKSLLLYAEGHLKQEKDKEEPSESLSGTYEEMYSNWRNKVEEAAKQNNVFASFINMCNLHYMFVEISSEISIETYNIMEEYNPDCLENNISLFDACLQKYEAVYKTAGIAIKRFHGVDEFAADYLEK